jgi:hypothetical protein
MPIFTYTFTREEFYSITVQAPDAKTAQDMALAWDINIGIESDNGDVTFSDIELCEDQKTKPKITLKKLNKLVPDWKDNLEQYP